MYADFNRIMPNLILLAVHLEEYNCAKSNKKSNYIRILIYLLYLICFISFVSKFIFRFNILVYTAHNIEPFSGLTL